MSILKMNHPQRKCWWRPNVECGNCGKLGSIEHSIVLSDSWLIYICCTNHMTNNHKLFTVIRKLLFLKRKLELVI